MPYPTPPGLRIPYDSDGTVGVLHPGQSAGGGILDVHPLALKALNSNKGAGLFVPSSLATYGDTRSLGSVTDGDQANKFFFCLLFPVATRLRGLFFSRALHGTGTVDLSVWPYWLDRVYVETSIDSTNGVDGTWISLGVFTRGDLPRLSAATEGISAISGQPQMSVAQYTVNSSVTARNVSESYRNLANQSGYGIQDITGVAARQVRAIRVYPFHPNSDGSTGDYPHGWYFLHLYGEPDTDSISVNRLQVWSAFADVRLREGDLDWGDVPLASSSDKRFRIKNHSLTSAANEVTIRVENLLYYPTSPSISDQFLFSLDGVTWAPSLNIPSIGPGTVSPEVRVRRVTPSNSPLTTYSPKIRLDVGSWS